MHLNRFRWLTLPIAQNSSTFKGTTKEASMVQLLLTHVLKLILSTVLRDFAGQPPTQRREPHQNSI